MGEEGKLFCLLYLHHKDFNFFQKQPLTFNNCFIIYSIPINFQNSGKDVCQNS